MKHLELELESLKAITEVQAEIIEQQSQIITRLKELMPAIKIPEHVRKLRGVMKNDKI